jgi:hypothetical protein
MRSRYLYKKQIKTDYEMQFPIDPMMKLERKKKLD